MQTLTNDYLNNNQSTIYPQFTDWEAYTPTTQGFTFHSSSFMWRRLGSDIEIIGTYSVASNDSSEYRLGTPNGVLVSSKIAKYPQVVGYMSRGISSVGARKQWNLLVSPSTNYLNNAPCGDPQGDNPLVPQAGDLGMNVNDVISFYAKFPVEGYSVSGTSNLSDLPDSRTLCKAWCNFNGNNAVIASSYNISNITRTSTGVYQATFTNIMNDANYSVSTSGSDNRLVNAELFTVNGFQITSRNSGGTLEDSNPVSFQVFGN